jgi:hypothetical protein
MFFQGIFVSASRDTTVHQSFFNRFTKRLGAISGFLWLCASYVFSAKSSSLSDLTVRSDRKTRLKQFLRSFEANSHSIQRERAQKMTKSGFSAAGQR